MIKQSIKTLCFGLSLLSMMSMQTLHAASPAQPDVLKQSYAQAAQITAEVGQRYLQAYFHKDWQQLEPLLAEHASFADPTATQLFGAADKIGKAAIMQAFRDNYAPISFQFQQESQMEAIDHAIFFGKLSWTYQLKQGQLVVDKMPMMVVLQIQDGKVISHRDYADYRPYFAAEAAVKAAKAAQKQ